MNFKPLVVDPAAETTTKQLQTGDELDIPLEARHQEFRQKYANLIMWMLEQRFPVPSDQIEYAQGVK